MTAAALWFEDRLLPHGIAKEHRAMWCIACRPLARAIGRSWRQMPGGACKPCWETGITSYIAQARSPFLHRFKTRGFQSSNFTPLVYLSIYLPTYLLVCIFHCAHSILCVSCENEFIAGTTGNISKTRSKNLQWTYWTTTWSKSIFPHPPKSHGGSDPEIHSTDRTKQ